MPPKPGWSFDFGLGPGPFGPGFRIPGMEFFGPRPPRPGGRGMGLLFDGVVQMLYPM